MLYHNLKIAFRWIALNIRECHEEFLLFSILLYPRLEMELQKFNLSINNI